MATFISTIHYTEQGRKNIKDTCDRAAAFAAGAKQMGVDVKNIFWTLGPYNCLVIFEAPDDATATALMLHLSSVGNVLNETVRAYEAPEMKQILDKLPA